MKRKALAVAVVSLVAYSLVLSVFYAASSPLQKRNNISSSGAVKAIDVMVYSDADYKNVLSSIDWGLLEPGESKNLTYYVRNEGNSAVTISLLTENWNPLNASRYIDLNWNYEGQSIVPDGVVEVTFTLVVSPSVEGITDFTFDIVIVGSG
jgi:hypothetical protein